MKIERGVVPSMMKEFKAAAASGNAISGAEVRRIMSKGIAQLKSEYAGADSEAGIAKTRNALATTFKAAARDWHVTSTGMRAARGMLGPELNGKGGTLAIVEQNLRNEIHTPTSFNPYR